MSFLAAGYQELFSGIYVRDTSLMGKEGPVTVKEVVTLSQYRKPTEDQVVTHLQEKAATLLARKKLAISGTQIQVASELESAVIQLPDNFLDDLKISNLNCIAFVRSNTPAINLPEGRQVPHYLQATFGYMPPELLSKLESGEIRPEIPLFGRFQGVLGSLSKQSSLGTRGSIDYLVNPERGDVGKMSGVYNNIPPSVMVELITEVTNVSADQKYVQSLFDVSPEKLEEVALPPILALHKNVREAIAQQIARQRIPQSPLGSLGLPVFGASKRRLDS